MESREKGMVLSQCAHHWRIAPPAGAFSTGVCAKCGVRREFPNSSEMSTFGYGRTRPRPLF